MLTEAVSFIYASFNYFNRHKKFNLHYDKMSQETSKKETS